MDACCNVCSKGRRRQTTTTKNSYCSSVNMMQMADFILFNSYFSYLPWALLGIQVFFFFQWKNVLTFTCNCVMIKILTCFEAWLHCFFPGGVGGGDCHVLFVWCLPWRASGTDRSILTADGNVFALFLFSPLSFCRSQSAPLWCLKLLIYLAVGVNNVVIISVSNRNDFICAHNICAEVFSIYSLTP